MQSSTIGVLVESGSELCLVGALARWAQETSKSLVVLEFPQRITSSPHRGLPRALRALVSAADGFVAMLEGAPSRGYPGESGALSDVRSVRMSPSDAIGAKDLPAAWATGLSDLGLDVVLDLRPRSELVEPMWTAQLAQRSRRGLLAVRWEGGQPTGFQSVAQERPTSGFQVMFWGPDGVLSGSEDVAAPTGPTFTTNLQMLCVRAAATLGRTADRLFEERSTDLRPAPTVSTDAFGEEPGDGVGVARYLVRLAMRTGARARRKLVAATDEYWSVALSPGDWKQCDFTGAAVIPNPTTGYLADPILHSYGNRTVLFVEEWIWSVGRGRISAMELDDDGTVGTLRPIIEEEFHLSFPFVFEYEGHLYMVPECWRQGQQRLYRCTDFPYEWVFERTLEGISGVDAMVFPWNGEWSLLIGADSTELGDPNAELQLFRALDPVRGPWRACAGNPVVADSRRARNGGLITQGGQLLRVSQEYGFRKYGVAVGISEISEISDKTYRETLIARIGEEDLPGVLGVHQLTCTPEWTAFDFRTYRRIGRRALHG